MTSVAVSFALVTGVPLGQVGLAMAAARQAEPARREVTAKRTATTRTWDNGDGTFTLESHVAPIHFVDGATGRYEPIDAAIVETVTPLGRAWRNKANSFTAVLPQGTGGRWASIECTAGRVAFRAASRELPEMARAADATGAPMVAGENGVRYPKAFDAADVEYHSLATGLKETIVLDRWVGRSAFSYDIVATDCTPKMRPDGSIGFVSATDGYLAFEIARPCMYDSSGETRGERACSEVVRYDLRGVGPIWRLDIVCDRAWLADPARVYPVMVDPTFAVGTCPDVADAYVTSAYPNNNYGSSTELRVGQLTSPATGNCYSFIRPDVSALAGWSVLKAELKVCCFHRHNGTSGVVGIDDVDGNWTESGITWNNKPPYDYLGSANVAEGSWATFDVTGQAEKWADGTHGQFGLMLWADAGTSGWAKFHSRETAYYPYLLVTYSTLPLARIVEPSPEVPVASNPAPEARWGYLDGWSKTQSRVEIEMRTSPQSANVWSSGQKSVTPTQTSLPITYSGWQAATRYFMRIRAEGSSSENGLTGWGRWSDWTVFAYSGTCVGSDQAGIEPYRASDAIAPGAWVDLATGRLQMSRTDLTGPGAAGAFAVSASYDSSSTSDADGLGRGWRLNVPSMVTSDEAAPNPGFEQVVAGDPAVWSLNNTSAVSSDSSVKRDGGQYSAKITNPTTLTVNLGNVASDTQGYPVWPGQRIRMSGWVRTSGMSVDPAQSARGVYIRAYFCDMDGTRRLMINSTNFETSNTTTWTPISLEATVPANAYKLRVIYEMKYAKGTVWFDDVHIGDGRAIHTDPDGTKRNFEQRAEGTWTRDPLAPQLALREVDPARGTSVTCTYENLNGDAGCSTDGDLTTAKSEDVYWKTDGSAYLQYTLDRPQMVSAAAIRFYDTIYQGKDRVYTYAIRTSQDGSSWTTVVPSPSSAATSVTGRGFVRHEFVPMRAKYVRLVAFGNTANAGFHVCEFELPQKTIGDVSVAFDSAGVLRGAGDAYGNISYASWDGTRLAGLWERSSAAATRGIEIERSGAAVSSLSYRGIGSTGTPRLDEDAVKYYHGADSLTIKRRDRAREVTAAAFGYSGGRVASISDGDGFTLRIAYDGSRVSTVTDAAGVTRSYSYGPTSVAIGTTGADGTVGASRTIGFLPAKGWQVTTATVSAAGQPALTSTLSYDAYGHVATSTDPLGVPDTVDADARGNALRAVAKGMLETTATYNSHDLASTVTDPKGNLAVFRYDERTWTLSSEAVALTDLADDGQTATSRLRDDRGRLTQSEYPAATTHNLLWNGTFEDSIDAEAGWGGPRTPSGLTDAQVREALGQAYTGTRTVALGGDWAVESISSDKVTVRHGERYCVSTWAAGSNGSIDILEYNAAGSLISSSSVAYVAGDWDGGLERLAAVYTPSSSGVAAVRVRLYSFADGQPTYFDNVRFERANAVGGDDLVNNESFEDTVSGQPTWWWKGSGTYASHELTQAERVEGEWAAAGVTTERTDGQGYAGFACDWIAVRPGEHYTVSGWMRTVGVRSTSGGGARIWARLYTQYQGSTYTTITVATATVGTQGWTRHVRTIEIPQGITHLRVECMADRCDGRSYWDAVCVEPSAGVETYGYDAATRSFVTTVTTRDGRELSAETDEYGRPVATRFAEQTGGVCETLQRRFYDGPGRLTEVVSAPESLAVSAGFAYTDGGRLGQVTDPRGNVTALGYDAAGRLDAVTDPLGYTARVGYDALGRPQTVYSPRLAGEATSVLGRTDYDAYGRAEVSCLRGLDGSGSTRTVAYDEGSRITSEALLMGGSAAVGSYTYDVLGRLTSGRTSGPAGSMSATTTYDRASLPTRIDWAMPGPSGVESRTVYNDFAKTNQWIETWGLGTPWYFATGADGRPLSVKSPYSSRSLSYDEAGRLTGVRLGRTSLYHPGRLEDFAGETLSYDVRGRIERTEWDGYLDREFQDGYGYDAVGRLVSWTRSGDGATAVTYGYDAAGNLTHVNSGGAQASTYAHNAADQLTAMTVAGGPETTFAYDRLGRLATRTAGVETTTYAWDAAGHLAQVRSANATFTYSYGVSGMRERKMVESAGTTAAVTDSLWLGGRLMAEVDSDGSVLRYLYGPGGIPLQLRVTRAGVTSKYAFQLDHAGSVVGITDEAGATVASYGYDPWGRVTHIGSGGGIDAWLQGRNPLRYRGYHLDAETQMYYLPARYYDPTLARFISRDLAPPQANDPLTLNRYAYCVNDPVNLSDPSGAIHADHDPDLDGDGVVDEDFYERYLNSYNGAVTPRQKEIERRAALPLVKRQQAAMLPLPPMVAAPVLAGLGSGPLSPGVSCHDPPWGDGTPYGRFNWTIAPSEPGAAEWGLAGFGLVMDLLLIAPGMNAVAVPVGVLVDGVATAAFLEEWARGRRTLGDVGVSAISAWPVVSSIVFVAYTGHEAGVWSFPYAMAKE